MLGGCITEREKGRFEILRVPSILKERDRLIGRTDPVLDRYARITFDKSFVVGQPQAELVAPGHPLLESLVDVVLERFQPLLSQGGVLVDEADARPDNRQIRCEPHTTIFFLGHSQLSEILGRESHTRCPVSFKKRWQLWEAEETSRTFLF